MKTNIGGLKVIFDFLTYRFLNILLADAST